MTSAFFRRPTDDSCSSSSSDEDYEVDLHSHQTNNSDEGEIQTVTTESLPSHGSASVGEEVDVPSVSNVDRHRTNLISALLEDFARNRANDYLNEVNPGSNFDKSSPEVQALAQTVYQQVSQSLALTGILPADNVRDDSPQARAAYLAGIESLALSNVQDQSTLNGHARPQLQASEQQLAVTRISNQRQALIPHVLQNPMANLSIHHDQVSSSFSNVTFSSTARQSHYESSFQQLKLLGKGGFGRVYHTYNIFDKKEYAVKKIPLSPRLSQRYKESGHKEIENVLREVQALAQLEHSNVVRYHATWIEEPKQTRDTSALYQLTSQSLRAGGRKLIADQPSLSPAGSSLPRPPTRTMAESGSGIVFGPDSRSTTPIGEVQGASERMWSANETDHEPSSIRPSEIFTDGNARPSIVQDSVNDESVYVLHVQMSVYPSTLAEYVGPVPISSRSGTPSKKHCFHLVPALRLLMGILCGLQYIHARGLIHRDIKPSNIFISTLNLATTELIPDGYHDVGSCAHCPKSNPYFVNPRIGDFGLVADLAGADDVSRSDNSRRSKKLVGTEYYRPPHQSEVDEKVDVFALGVILIELLWPCFTSTERMHVLRDVQKGRPPQNLARKIESEGHQPGTGDMIIECISGMIEPDARVRWSCAQIKDRLEMLLKRCETSIGAGAGDEIMSENEMGRVKSVDESMDQTPSLDGRV